MLEIKKIQKQFERATDKSLDKVSFKVDRGQFVSILGESGAGKTTLLKIVAGLEQADSGEVLFDKVKVKGPHEKLIAGHPSIELVHQDFELAHHTKVELNVKQKLRARNIPENIANKRVSETLKICGIDHLKAKKIEELSGGEKQRLAIARALVSKPDLILLDEPFSHLDHPNKEYFKKLILEIKQQSEVAILMVTHNAIDALELTDLIIILRKGKVMEIGTPEVLYHTPSKMYTAGLMGDYNLLDDSENLKIIRPERIKKSPKEKVGYINVKVLKSRFQGDKFLVSVQDAQNKIWLIHNEISLEEQSYWWIDIN